MFGHIRHSLAFWRERDQIIEDLQLGFYTVKQTVERLAQHALPGGRTRSNHVFSCRNGYAPCKCPFDFDLKNLVNL